MLRYAALSLQVELLIAGRAFNRFPSEVLKLITRICCYKPPRSRTSVFEITSVEMRRFSSTFPFINGMEATSLIGSSKITCEMASHTFTSMQKCTQTR